MSWTKKKKKNVTQWSGPPTPSFFWRPNIEQKNLASSKKPFISCQATRTWWEIQPVHQWSLFLFVSWRMFNGNVKFQVTVPGDSLWLLVLEPLNSNAPLMTNKLQVNRALSSVSICIYTHILYIYLAQHKRKENRGNCNKQEAIENTAAHRFLTSSRSLPNEPQTLWRAISARRRLGWRRSTRFEAFNAH